MARRILPPGVLAVVPCLLISYALLRHSGLPPFAVALFTVFIVTSAFWPAQSLAVVAAFAPFMAAFASHWARPVRWSEAVVISFLSGAGLRLAFRPPGGRSRLRGIELVGICFGAVVLASWLVELAMLQYATDFPGHFLRVVWALFTRHYFQDPGAFTRLNDALLLIEGIALMVCVGRIGRGEPGVPGMVIRMSVVGAAAAAMLNVQRLAQLLLQGGGDRAALMSLLPSTRYSVLHMDVNAAGSYFAMALLLALGLGANGRKQLGWFFAAALVLAALWLTGSRAALGSAAIAVVGLLAALTATAGSRAARLVPRVVLGGALVAIAVIALTYPRNRNTPVSAALGVRADMARVSLNLFATRPVFGIGVGTFWQRSAEYMPDRLRASYTHENAHNNFLQILAELGMAGLAGFLLLIVLAARAVQSIRGPDRTLLAGLLTGILAFLLTCLAGHPLLTREVAYPFWLVLGSLAALHRPHTATAPLPRGERESQLLNPRAWTAAIVAALAVSLPFRIQIEKRSRNLDNTAIGVSVWSTADDGVRFRWAQPRVRFFVPGADAFALIPLRLAPDVPHPLRVDIRLDGRLANSVTVTRDRWTSVRVVLARTGRTPRSRLIELDVQTPAGEEVPPRAGAVLMVGRISGS
jgi:O-antigen ligase